MILLPPSHPHPSHPPPTSHSRPPSERRGGVKVDRFIIEEMLSFLSFEPKLTRKTLRKNHREKVTEFGREMRRDDFSIHPTTTPEYQLTQNDDDEVDDDDDDETQRQDLSVRACVCACLWLSVFLSVCLSVCRMVTCFF